MERQKLKVKIVKVALLEKREKYADLEARMRWAAKKNPGKSGISC